jgi:predicted nucleic acid-binding protein
MQQIDGQIAAVRTFIKIADDTEAVITQLLELLKAYSISGKQVHDANIAATMLVNGIDTLLTLNVDDLKRFSDKIALLTPTLENS